jgi:hypothetical protein
MGFMLKPVMPGLAAFAKATAAWHRKSPSKPRRGRVPGTTSSLLLKEKDVDGRDEPAMTEDEAFSKTKAPFSANPI